jgi:hypothetical protein
MVWWFLSSEGSRDQVAHQTVQPLRVKGAAVWRLAQLGSHLDVLFPHAVRVQVTDLEHDVVRADVVCELGSSVLGAVQQVLDDTGHPLDVPLHHLPALVDRLPVPGLETRVDDEHAALQTHQDVLDPVGHTRDRSAHEGELAL